ncbi:hypothetical protein, partial [Pseudomonas syringae]|uniref:hypothetical protein n=1 Tax=Pseudomonas syringae TaxID=317 RepID=UPI001CA5DCAF
MNGAQTIRQAKAFAIHTGFLAVSSRMTEARKQRTLHKAGFFVVSLRVRLAYIMPPMPPIPPMSGMPPPADGLSSGTSA